MLFMKIAITYDVAAYINVGVEGNRVRNDDAILLYITILEKMIHASVHFCSHIFYNLIIFSQFYVVGNFYVMYNFNARAD